MPALPFAFPDAEGAARAWGRSLNLANLGQRVFFGIPRKATFPLAVVQRISGRPVRGVPIDQPVIQWDLWGETPVAGQQPKDKMVLATIATALVGAAESLASGTVIAPGVVCLGAEVESGPVWQPSPTDGRSRYTLDIGFSLRVA